MELSILAHCGISLVQFSARNYGWQTLLLCPYHHQQRSGSQQATTRLKLLIHGHSNLFLWLFSKCDQIQTRENPARLSRKAKNNEVYSIRQTPKAFVCFGFRSTTYFHKVEPKYYSPSVTNDKIFVQDFCVLQQLHRVYLQDTKVVKENLIISNSELMRLELNHDILLPELFIQVQYNVRKICSSD